MSNTSSQLSGDSDRNDPLLDALLDELVVQIESGADLQVEQLCVKYPQYAQRVRQSAKALSMLVEIGQCSNADSAAGTGVRRETLDVLLIGAGNDDAAHDLIGKTIDRFKIRERLGEGGFGIVHVAEQLQPVRRKVAIKVIKLGMDSHEVLARFDAERQALAIMDHPNIAKIFDGGLTEDGRPYFAMELVKGVPLTQFCDQQRLSLQNRLELFCDICDAVQHAHHKGIIHRDLKPTNVLVTMRDDTPTVKVIDFGVAKALHTRLTEHSIYTSFGQLVGTPLYMSPEQIQLNEFDVDTRSDVYSLGVILYELMTQSLPFSRKTLKEEGLESFRKLVCDSDPPRPSHRLSSRRGQAQMVDSRGTPDPPAMTIPSELDWIVMKALEKNRTRRYQSAGSLADDIRRFRNGDPVEACPPAMGYRLRKYMQRNRWQIAAVAALFLVLVAGIAATSYQAARARDAQQIATRLAATATQKTEQAIAEKERADQRTEFARNVVDRMYGEFAFEWLGQNSKLTDLQHEFLESAMVFYRQLSQDELAAPEAQHAAAVASYRYGSILLKFRRWEEAGAALERALAGFKTLGDRDQFPIAAPLWSPDNEQGPLSGRETFEFEQRMLGHPLGSLITVIGKQTLIPDADVLGSLEKSIGYSKRLADQYPWSPLLILRLSTLHRHYAHALLVREKLSQSLDQIRRAEKLFGQVKPRLAQNNFMAKREEVWILVTRSEIDDQRGDVAQTETTLLDADRLVREALQGNPEMSGYVRDKIMIKRKLSMLYDRLGRTEDATAYRLAFCAAQIELSDLVPYDSQALNNGAWFLLIRDDLSDEEAKQAMRLAERSLERDPKSSPAHNTMGLALYRLGEYDEAIRYFEQSRELSDLPDFEMVNQAMLALTFHAKGDHDKALELASVVRKLSGTVPITFDVASFVRRAIELLPEQSP